MPRMLSVPGAGGYLNVESLNDQTPYSNHPTTDCHAGTGCVRSRAAAEDRIPAGCYLSLITEIDRVHPALKQDVIEHSRYLTEIELLTWLNTVDTCHTWLLLQSRRKSGKQS